MTPEGTPFLAATYLSPVDRDGRRGLPAVLADITAGWRDNRAGLIAGGARKRLSAPPTPDPPIRRRCAPCLASDTATGDCRR